MTNNEKKAIKKWDHEDLAMRYLLLQCLPNSIAIHLQVYTTAKTRWDHLVSEFTAQSVYAQNNLEQAFFDMHCVKGVNVCVFLTSLHYKREELAAAGVLITQKEYQHTVLKSLLDELAKFTSQLLTSARIGSHILDTDTLITSIIEELECLKNWCTHG